MLFSFRWTQITRIIVNNLFGKYKNCNCSVRAFGGFMSDAAASISIWPNLLRSEICWPAGHFGKRTSRSRLPAVSEIPNHITENTSSIHFTNHLPSFILFCSFSAQFFPFNSISMDILRRLVNRKIKMGIKLTKIRIR